MSRKHNSPGIYFREIAMKNPYTESTKKIVENNTSTNSNVAHMLNAASRVKIEPYKVDMIHPDSVALKAYYCTELYGEVLSKQDVTDSCEWYINSVDATIDNGVVTINKTGVNAEVAAVYKGFKGKAMVSVKSVNSYYLELSTTSISLNKGDKTKVTAKYYQIKDGVLQEGIDVTSKCEWISDNPSAISVKNGVITAIKTGVSGVVTAKYNDEEVNVVVTVASSYHYELKLSKTNITLNKSEQETIVATYFVTENGKTDNGTIVTSDCEWISDNPSAISVENGVITAIKSGVNGVVTAKYNDLIVQLNVSVPSLITSQKLEISAVTSLAEMVVGTGGVIKAIYTEVKDDITSVTDVTNSCTWVYDSAIIKINSGNITVVSTGKSGVISATYNNITSNTLEYSTKSVVTSKLIISFVNGYTSNFEVDNETRLMATLQTTLDGEIRQEDVTDICAWVSNNDSVSVSKGIVTAISSGQKATIYANYNNNLTSNYINISVNDKVTTRLEITPYQIVLDKDNSQQLTVKYYTSINGVEDSWTDVTMSCTWEYDSSKLHLINGKVTALVYDATDYIVAKYNGVTSNTVTVTINPHVPEISYVLELTPKNIELPFGETEQLTVTKYEYIEESGVVADVGDDITEQCSWIISNDKIQVSDKGVLSSTEDNINGTIQATCEILPFGQLYTNIISVNVFPKNTYRLLIYPQELILEKDYTVPIECRYYSTINGVETYEVCTNACTWKYDDSILKIENGNITALKSNIKNTTITATYEGYTDTINISINSHVVSELKIENGPEIDLEKDFVEPLTIKYYTVTDGVSDGGVDVTEECVITTTNENVKVDKHKVIMAVTPNSNSMITARYNDYIDTCNVAIPPESAIRHMFIKVLEDNTIISFSQQSLEYSIDEGNTWFSLSPDNTMQSFNKGKVYFKQVINHTDGVGIGTFSVNKPFHVGGNILSLITGDEMTDIPSNITFRTVFKNLFKDCNTLLKVSKTLLMVQTTLPIEACVNMFEGCENLINAPDLPQGGNRTFNEMFKNCKSLVVPPVINETVFMYSCNSMFSGCESLSYMSDFSFTSSVQSHQGMFQGCINLKDASNITISHMGINSCLGMFSGCVSLLNSPNIICSSVTASGAAASMFQGCSNLRYIKFLANTIDTSGENGVLSNWVAGVAPTGKFVMSSDAQWKIIGESGIPEGWEIIYEGIEVTSNNKALMNVGETFVLNCIADDYNPTGITQNNVISECSFNSTNDSIEVNEYGIATVSNIPENGNCDLTVTYKNNSKTLKVNIVETIPYVEGYVKDENGVPLQDVVITIYGIGNLTTTDAFGYYCIYKNNALFENESLIFIKNGYEDKIVKINGQNTIDVTLTTENCSETFVIDDMFQKVDIFGGAYLNAIMININKSKEEAETEFSYTYQNTSEIFNETFPPDFKFDKYAGGSLFSDFSISFNKGRERAGYVTIRHKGGWHATITVIQKGALQFEDIPYDAYKTIIPNVTPWIETHNESQITMYNMGKAQKVLYLWEETMQPSARLYIPGATDKTTFDFAITEIDDNNSATLENYISLTNYEIHEPSENAEYPYKRALLNIGVRNHSFSYKKKNATHETVVITFLVRNYDNQEGNYIAIPFRIVQCKNTITKKEFDEVVAKYGPSNYNGTMNDITGFDFPPLPTPNEINVGYTPWLSTHDLSYETVYGNCNRVLYMTYDPDQWVPVRVNYIDNRPEGVHWPIYHSLRFSCEDGGDNNIEHWMDTEIDRDSSINDNGVEMIYLDVAFRPRSEFKGTINNNHRVIKFNFKVIINVSNGKIENFNIPFTIVQCRRNITKGEFDDLVKKYGPSNYDGTMGDLSKFNF